MVELTSSSLLRPDAEGRCTTPEGEILTSSPERDGAGTVPSSFSVTGRVYTIPSCISSVTGKVLAERRKNMNQVNAANKDDEMKNREVNMTNATMRCEYINQLK